LFNFAGSNNTIFNLKTNLSNSHSMKKLLLFFSLLLSLLPLQAAAETKTATITFADQGWENAKVLSNVSCTIVASDTKEEIASVKFSKGSNSLDPKYYTSDKTARIYAGNIIEIKAVNDTKNTITKVSSAPSATFTKGNDGTFSCSSKTNFKSITVTYEVTQVTSPAEMPEVIINGIAIEEGCFYEVSNGSKAEVSAKDATSISILYNDGNDLNELTGSKGTFDITNAGEYVIESANGEYGGETLSFNVKLVEPKEIISTTDVWEKVLSTETITDEGEYILVCEDKNDVASNEDNDNNRKVLPISITDSNIKSLLTPEAQKQPLILNIKKEGESNYYLFATNYAGNTSKGNYLTGKDSKNYLLIGEKDASKDNAIATISITDGNATITFTNISRTIRRNSSSDLYGAYAQGQTAIQLYKRGADEQTVTYEYSTAEFLDLPQYEHDALAKTITFSCSNKNVLFEERHYEPTTAQTYAPKAVAEGWNAIADNVFDHSAFDKDMVMEVRAYREDADGNRVIESPIHAIKIPASGTVTGIEGVNAEAEGEGELYNLQGARVDRRAAAPGLYIERRGSKAVKVVL